MTRQRLKAAALLLGFAGLLLVVVRTAEDVRGSVLPSPWAIGIGVGFAIVSLLAAGRSWVALLPGGSDRRAEILGALYLSQLSKYLPAGGVVQAAGQVSMSIRSTIPAAAVLVAYPIAMVEVLAMGSVLAAGLVVAPDVPAHARVLAALAPISVVALDPRLLRWLLALGRRIWSRIPDGSHIPDRRTIGASTAWALVNMASTSAAFVVMLRSIAPDVGLLGAFSGFAAAWVIGFLAVPVPSGLGVREAVLLLVVPELDTGQLLAAALAHRIATVGAEVLVTAVNAALRRRYGSPRVAPDPTR